MKPQAELLYNLAALASVAALAYFSFWGFLAVVGTSVAITLSLLLAERLIGRR